MNGSVKATFGEDLGLLQPDRGESCVFFHASGLIDVEYRDLREGDCLSWDVERSKGLFSKFIKKCSRALAAACPEQLYVKTSAAADTFFQKEITANLIRRLSRDPSDLFLLKPEQFEELVADLFVVEGYTVELMGAGNHADGGVDILAISPGSGWQSLKTAIQCKRYRSGKKLSADPIRSLAGVLDRFQAHAGVIVTTSDFTKPAAKELLDYWRITGVNYAGLKERLLRAELLLPPPIPGFRDDHNRRPLDDILRDGAASNIRRL